jgi:hypothetical protein
LLVEASTLARSRPPPICGTAAIALAPAAFLAVARALPILSGDTAFLWHLPQPLGQGQRVLLLGGR